MKTLLRTLAALTLASAFCLGEDNTATPPPVNPSAPSASPSSPATVPETPAHHHHNPKKQFKKLDTNHDGFLSLQEFEASKKGQKNPAKAEKVYRKMDTKGDGKVTLEESVAYHEQHAGKR